MDSEHVDEIVLERNVATVIFITAVTAIMAYSCFRMMDRA